jgi:hypothetical protein
MTALGGGFNQSTQHIADNDRRYRPSYAASLVSCAGNKLATCGTAKKPAETLQFGTRAWQIAHEYEAHSQSACGMKWPLRSRGKT